MINKNLKKCAASLARPAIQYVLYCRIRERSTTGGLATHIVATRTLGMILNGTTSKMNLDSSHAVGL